MATPASGFIMVFSVENTTRWFKSVIYSIEAGNGSVGAFNILWMEIPGDGRNPAVSNLTGPDVLTAPVITVCSGAR